MVRFCLAAKVRSSERSKCSSRLTQARWTPFAEKSLPECCNDRNSSSEAGSLADQKHRRSGLPENEARVRKEPEASCKLKSGAGKGSRSQIGRASANCPLSATLDCDLLEGIS